MRGTARARPAHARDFHDRVRAGAATKPAPGAPARRAFLHKPFLDTAIIACIERALAPAPVDPGA